MNGCEMGHEIKECNVAKDGVCALHGVEVERRKNSANRIFISSALVVLVISASFIYTRDVKLESDYKSTVNRTEIENLAKQGALIITAQARTEEKYVAVLRELENLNGQIRVLIRSGTEGQGTIQTRKRGE